MDNRSCVHFEDSEDDFLSEDEHQLSRISMFLNIDISKKNKFHRTLSVQRKPRNHGGGLFGAVRNRYVEESLISIAVPNKFFAASRSFCHKYGKLSKHSTERHRKTTMSFEPTGYGRHNEPESDRYSRYNNRRTHRDNLRESYECPRRFSSHCEERNINYSGYNDYNNKPHHEYYRRKACQKILRDTLPDYGNDSEYTTDRVRTKRRRCEKHHEGKVNFYTPLKSTDKSYRQNPTESQNFQTIFKKISRNDHRQSSGCINTDYRSTFNPHEYYDSTRNHSLDFGSDCEHYDSTPDLNYPMSALKKCDYDYNNYEDPELYENRMPSYRKKSVDFFGPDCERSRSRQQRNMLVERHVCHSAMEIPHKQKLYEPAVKRSHSGCDCSLPRTYQESFHACSPVVRRNRWHGYETFDRHYRTSLKNKISGFFKKSKSKSRTKCSQNPLTQYDCRCHGSISNMKPKNPKVYLDHSQSVSSMSLSVAKSCTIPFKPAKKSNRKIKCITYPTNYRDKCALRKEECQRYSLSKVNGSQCELSKRSSESSNVSKDHSAKDASYCCCCPTESIPHSAPLSYSTIPILRTQNAIQPSTINLCLTICTADGKLINPTSVTTTPMVSGISQNNKQKMCSNQNLPSISSRQSLQSGHCCRLQNCAAPCHNKINSEPIFTKKSSTTSKKVSVSEQPDRIYGFGIPKETNSGSDCCSPLLAMEKRPAMVTPCQSDTYTIYSENDFRCVRCSAGKTSDKQLNIKQSIGRNAEDCKCNPYKRSSLDNSNKKERNEILRTCKAYSISGKSCCKTPTTSSHHCNTKKVESICVAETAKQPKLPASKVELPQAPNPLSQNQEPLGSLCVPTTCECPESFVENLKRELLDNLRSEQESLAQLQFQTPTSHVMFLPAVPTTIRSNANACQSDSHRVCWAPL